jgi:hypothetical protein
VVLLPLAPVMSGLALITAIGSIAVAAPTLKRLDGRAHLSVWGWSAVSLISLVTKFGVAALALGTVSGVGDIVTLALVVLAGMSIPIGVGGFGPREAVAAIAFAAVGLSADAGVATAAAYGMLAAVSALPGVGVMLFDLVQDGRSTAKTAELAPVEPVAVLAPVAVPALPVPVPVRIPVAARIPGDNLAGIIRLSGVRALRTAGHRIHLDELNLVVVEPELARSSA